MPKLVSRMIHSLLLRLLVMLATLGAVVVAALVVSWLVFETIEENMTSLTNERMPDLRSSANVVASMDRIGNLLTATLTATTSAELEEQAASADQVFEGFRDAVNQLPEDERNAMLPALEEAQAAVAKLLDARSLEFEQNASMRDTLALASQNASLASSLVEEANDNAFFDMTMSGEETITVIDDTLTRLVDEDFNQLQSALSIRSDINLITGLAIAYGQGQNSQINSIITDLATSAMDRLKVLISENAETAALQDVLPPLNAAIETYAKVFTARFQAPDTSEIMAARLAVDTVLSSALDDINFNLFIGSDEAKETNKQSLSRLLDQEVEGMRRNASLDATTKQFFVLLLQVAATQSPADLALKQQELLAQGDDVRRLKAGSIFDGQPNMEALLALSHSESGIAAQKATAFDAQAKALVASQEATHAVDAIAQVTSRFSSAALTKISQSAEALSGNVAGAKTQLAQISYAALAILIASPILMWACVTRPIGRVTKVTERLAQGDLSEITDLKENPGELGRMASALGVFRASALKSIEMQEAERQRERAALEDEKRAEREKLDKERRLAAEKANREQQERALAEKQAEKEEARRQKEEADRQERMREQAFIVSSLAEGLKGLAAGDLTCRIDTRFPDTYDALRHDFNAATEKLAGIIDQLKDSSHTIEGSCSELAAASDDLARRTEVNATTLEETAATIARLSTSVSDSADGASQASETIQNVREKANLNNDVMKQASAAMARVEDSSSKITSIVGLIESIAFQTNLLALNAGVEAARAGDAGQGFAVVANEVRVLAQRCSEAAKDISEVVEESASTVQNGVDLTNEANKAMEMINSDIDQISTIVEGIAQSAGRQSEGLKGVNEAIQQLDRTTQSNAAMFEETTASNRLLSSEASTLSGVVASFKLDGSIQKKRDGVSKAS